MPLMQSPPGAVTQIDGREYLYFVGTGYLGLQGHPEVIRAACEAAQQYGIGSANSRTAFGTTPPVLEVERNAAATVRPGRCVLFCLRLAGQQHPDAAAGRPIRAGADRRVFPLQRLRGRTCLSGLVRSRDLSPPRPRRPSRQAEGTPRTRAKPGGAQRRGLCRHRANRPGRRVLRHSARLSGLGALPRRRPRLGRAGRERPRHLRACRALARLPSPFGRGAGGEGGRRVAEQSVAVRPTPPALPCPALLRHAEQGGGRFRRHHSRQPGVHRPHQVDNRRYFGGASPPPRRLPRPPPGRSNWSWPSPGCGRGCGRTRVC